MAPGLARAEMKEGRSHAEEARDIEELLAAGNHREALARCARVYAAPIGRLCMAFTGSQADSEELVQETLLAAYDAFPTYRAEGSVRAFLFGIARRICGRFSETQARQKARLRLVHDTSSGRADAGELALEKERASRAREALAKLKPSEREALVLRYDAGLSFREVAQACGIDEAAARKRVSRALGKMRAEIGEE
ncbi:sigma-70 family RNA polymerase sigma factor [Polyangium spumosum]|uniref:RNA polymerase sigma factor n=2 Tax=Polyangium spumosum TaxID=889282 RepID=A0A6N7PR80_9BACT|nr:sigma-70 family RNA polymerase sigma factor [Polyangium spumosum]